MSIEYSSEKTKELLKFYFNLAIEGGIDGDNMAEIDEIVDYIFDSIKKVSVNNTDYNKIKSEIKEEVKQEILTDIIKALDKS